MASLARHTVFEVYPCHSTDWWFVPQNAYTTLKSSIPLNRMHHSVFTHFLADEMWVAFSLQPLSIKLLATFSTSLCMDVRLSFLLGKHLHVIWSGYTVSTCLTL